jgi:nucleoid-associated protein YgaU
MFDPKSRYANLAVETYNPNSTTSIPYVSRRFLPQAEDMPTLQQVTVQAGDRIDLIANRTLGDPLQFWRICDANDAMYPLALTSQPGQVLVIPVPGR